MHEPTMLTFAPPPSREDQIIQLLNQVLSKLEEQQENIRKLQGEITALRKESHPQ